jgi:hypothetical protein
MLLLKKEEPAFLLFFYVPTSPSQPSPFRLTVPSAPSQPSPSSPYYGEEGEGKMPSMIFPDRMTY